MGKQISENRKAAFYIGMGLMAVGFISFFSVFVTFIFNFGDFSNFESDTKSSMIRAFGGVALISVGGLLRGIGARGLAGSGTILDPEQAKEELEPYSRAAGGMAKDFLEEADVKLGGNTEQVVMIRCRECGKLNEEDSKFCQECGQEV